MSLAVEARGLVKRYGAFAAVQGLDLAIEEGTVFGLLGPNGSGKTTTILMLIGLTEASAGTVRVLGLDPLRQPLEVKRAVGYMPDSVGFYDELTARENLRYSGKLAGLSGSELERRIDAALERVRLAHAADQRVKVFSRGMRQRLGLAEVLLKKPRLAILDEPTSGLDPQATHEFLDMIRGLKADGITVLLSSHLLDQVQAVCDRVGLFHRGRMVLEGPVERLAREVLGGGYRISAEAEGNAASIAAALARIPGVNGVEPDEPNRYRVSAERDLRSAVAEAVTGAGGTLLSLGMQRPTLDEVYNEYFRRSGGEEARHAA
ncbi:MAG TPA: ABC transporter ATP-binding protein [Burkholderiales bacterium]